jgi:hypothetical protein
LELQSTVYSVDSGLEGSRSSTIVVGAVGIKMVFGRLKDRCAEGKIFVRFVIVWHVHQGERELL